MNLGMAVRRFWMNWLGIDFIVEQLNDQGEVLSEMSEQQDELESTLSTLSEKADNLGTSVVSLLELVDQFRQSTAGSLTALREQIRQLEENDADAATIETLQIQLQDRESMIARATQTTKDILGNVSGVDERVDAAATSFVENEPTIPDAPDAEPLPQSEFAGDPVDSGDSEE